MKQFLLRRFDALKTTERRWLRKTIAVLLVLGGILGFLPVLGYWMLPLGLYLLAVDFPLIRRMNRRVAVWYKRRRRGANGNTGNGDDGRAARAKNHR